VGKRLLYNSLMDTESTICVFADETKASSSEGDVLRVAAWAIPSSCLQDCAPSLREVLSCSLKRRTQSVLDWLSARMCVGLITDTVHRSRSEPIAQADPRDPPLPNVIWSFSVGFSLAQMAVIAAERWPLLPMHIYHDPQSLSQEHMSLFREGFIRVVSNLQNRQRQHDYPGLDVPVSVKGIQGVAKALPGSDDSDVQLGTKVAHWLTKTRSEDKIPVCIKRSDLTEEINKRLTQMRDRVDKAKLLASTVGRDPAANEVSIGG
jgi:hypothetical protein